MRYLIAIHIILLSFFLSAQEKGLTPSKLSQANEEGSTFAVVVGISDYQDEGIPDLRFADKDAKAFAHFLRSSAGGNLDEDHLKVLINQEATAAQFAIALDWLWEEVNENDRVIIYFSGHGDVERKSITQPGYLLCWDAPARVYMAGGAFNVRDLNDVVSTLSIQNKAKVVLITDACRAGKLSGSGIGGAQATAANLAKQYANEIKILSCQPDEYSIEGEQWGDGRGAFSYHLLDGLYGMADENSDQSVNVLEIGRYLEDNVTREVAPQSQIPMTIGSRGEKLTDVFPDILAQLKEGRKGQLQLFAASESRGIEDEVLAVADTHIVEIYFALQKAIEQKQFLEPENASADFYYEKLSQEPQLEKLHSSMRRNYAAALQDDAQQVMNTMLKSGLTEIVLRDAKAPVLYKNYPAYFQRAAELLGNQHYMYSVLEARKYYFEAQIAAEPEKKRALYKKALSQQAKMPHAMVGLILSSDADQLDSASHYFQKAIDLVPFWVEPYIAFSTFYKNRLRQPDKAEELLNMANQIDSTSLLVWYKKAQLYNSQRKYKAAEKWYLKTTEAIEGDICFPCAYHDLGLIYRATRRYEEAEKHFKKAIQLDSTFTYAYNNLAGVYFLKGNFTKAEKNLKKSIQCDSLYLDTYLNLAFVYARMHRDAEAEQNFKKAIELNPTFVFSYNSLGSFFIDMHRYEEAEHYFMKATQLDSTFWMAYANLGLLYQNLQRWEAAEPIVIKAIHIAPPLASLHAMLGNTYTHLPGKIDEAKGKFDKALEMDPDSPDTYIYLAQWSLKKDQSKKAWQFLEQGLEKGIENGQLNKDYLITQSDFEEMQKDPKWNELMEKYFPEENKK